MEALRHIDRDTDLKDEILTRISETPDLGERLWAAAGTSRTGPPPEVSVDRARDVLEHASELLIDPPLEAIIILMGRPVLLVQNDDIDLESVDMDTWRERLEPAHDNLRAAIRSVGRIELDNHPQLDWVGTGWLVADDVLVTNRHVAEVFTRAVGEQFRFRSSVLGQMAARVDFREEHQGDSAIEFRINEIVHMEDVDGPDMAFFRVDWAGTSDSERRPPIRLASSMEGARTVGVIGYPAKDTRTRIDEEMDRIFANIYDVKRLAPGEVTGVVEAQQVLTHDCTTLGGNSGSVVLDVEAGTAIALHFAGREQVGNFAVSAPAVQARLEQIL